MERLEVGSTSRAAKRHHYAWDAAVVLVAMTCLFPAWAKRRQGKAHKSQCVIDWHALEVVPLAIQNQIIERFVPSRAEGKIAAIRSCLVRLTDPDDLVRLRAIESIESLLPFATEPKVRKACVIGLRGAAASDENFRVRCTAAVALMDAATSPQADSAALVDSKALTNMVREVIESQERPAKRALAVQTLGRVGWLDAEATVPLLIRAMKDEHVEVRRAAARELIAVGAWYGSHPSRFDPFVEDLFRLSADYKNDNELVGACHRMLRDASPARVIPHAIAVVKDDDRRARLLAISLLHNRAMGNKAAVRALLPVLAEPRGDETKAPDYAAASAEAVGQIMDESSFVPEVVDALAKLLGANSANRRQAASTALHRLGSLGARATPRIAEMVSEYMATERTTEYAFHRHARYEPLFTVGPSPPQWLEILPTIARGTCFAECAVDTLVAALQSSSYPTRIVARESLLELGSDAAPARPALRKLLDHDRGDVRVNAALLLEQMDSEAEVVGPES